MALASMSSSRSEAQEQLRKDQMSAMRLAMLRNQYGDIVNAAQSYSSNPDSLSARNTFFQALRANDATKAGANTMLGNRGSAGDVINGALGATGILVLAICFRFWQKNRTEIIVV